MSNPIIEQQIAELKRIGFFTEPSVSNGRMLRRKNVKVYFTGHGAPIGVFVMQGARIQGEAKFSIGVDMKGIKAFIEAVTEQ